jgi:hypothetical protein
VPLDPEVVEKGADLIEEPLVGRADRETEVVDRIVARGNPTELLELFLSLVARTTSFFCLSHGHPLPPNAGQ